MVLDDVGAEPVVDQEAGEHQQRRARYIQQGADSVGKNIVEPRSPAVRPDMAECGHHAIGDDRLEIGRHKGEGIESDRPRGIGGIDVDEIVGARARNLGERRFGEVAVGIEQRNAFAGNKVLADEIEQEGALAGAGLSDNIKMTTALLGIEHDGLARNPGADAKLLC